MFVVAVLTPRARTIFGLSPVARTAVPISVPKNQYIKRTTVMRTGSAMRKPYMLRDKIESLEPEKIVVTCSSGVLGLPMIRRLIV